MNFIKFQETNATASVSEVKSDDPIDLVKGRKEGLDTDTNNEKTSSDKAENDDKPSNAFKDLGKNLIYIFTVGQKI